MTDNTINEIAGATRPEKGENEGGRAHLWAQLTVDCPGDVGLRIGGDFKWAKDMNRDELLRLVATMRRESERQREVARDAGELLERATKLLEWWK